ncbi:MAG: MFS transporter [Moorellaceae bacterium]
MVAEKLKGSIITLFCLGEIGMVLMNGMGLNFFTYFLTDVALVSAALVGTIMLVGRIVDAVSVPVVGVLVEKVEMRWGKYRSWLVVAPFLAAICFILMFSNPGLGAGSKVLFYGVLYILSSVFLNIPYTAQSALIPVMATDLEDRTRLSGRRIQMLSLGQIIGGVVTVPLLLWLGGGSEARGFLPAIIVFAVLHVLGYQLMAAVSKPYVVGQRVETGETVVTLGDIVRQVFANPPLLVFGLTEFFKNCTWPIIFAIGPYYFKYVANNMAMLTIFLTGTTVAKLVGAVIGEALARKMSKKTVYVVGMVVMALTLVGARAFAGNAGLFTLFVSLAFAGEYISHAVNFAIYADTTVYSEWKTGKRANAIIMSVFPLTLRISQAVAGALTGYALAMIGYAGGAQVGAEMGLRISSVGTLVPALFALLAAVVMLFYNFTEDKVLALEKEIKEKRGVASTASA